MKAPLHPGRASPLSCSLSSSCSRHQQQSCILSTAFRKGEGNPRLGGVGGAKGRSPKLQAQGSAPHLPSHQGRGPPIFPGTTRPPPAPGGMLGEARSHSSAPLLGAAGDWRRVTSPLPRHGSRASPAIFGSGTSAYRQEARAVPPNGHAGRIAPTGRGTGKAGCADSPGPLPKPPARCDTVEEKSPVGQAGVLCARSTGKPSTGAGWRPFKPGGLAGGNGEGDARMRSREPPFASPQRRLSHLSIPPYRWRARAFAPCQRGQCQPSPGIPTPLHPSRGLGTPLPAHGPPPSADQGQRLSHAAQEHPRTHASPATSPERAGPRHLAAFKRTVLLSSSGRGWRRQCHQPLPEPPRPSPPAPLGTKVGSWFSAPQRQMEPGMLTLTRLEKHAAQETTQMPWGWAPGSHAHSPPLGSPDRLPQQTSG